LISVVSLLTPWYVLRAGDLNGLGKSGVAALGILSLLVVVLAIAAGWSGTARAHPLLPSLSAGVLALIVLVKFVSPPAAASALSTPATGDAIQAQFTNAMASTLSTALGMRYVPAWGIWLAAIGAAAALTGTIAVVLEDADR
jgi:hypothetical protein